MLAAAKRIVTNLWSHLFVAPVRLWPLSHLPAARERWAESTRSARTSAFLARRRLVHHAAPLCKTALSNLSSRGFPVLGTAALLGCVCPNSVLRCSINSKAAHSLDLHCFDYRLRLLNSTTEQNIHILR